MRPPRSAFVLALSLLLAPAIAQAAPITYDFSVTATTGPLAGATSSGTFTFDSSIIPAGGGTVNQTGLLTDLNFTWNGIVYDETTANTGGLTFAANGSLSSELFGNHCFAGGCLINSGTNDWAMLGQVFFYASGGGSAVVSLAAAPTPVPEPASMSLLGLGLVGGAVARARRRRSQQLVTPSGAEESSGS